jgi:CHAT domain-containing protein
MRSSWSPDSRGNYALTGEVIRTTTLHNHPVVVLGACQSARGAHHEHAPWSLSDAFLKAGARAVFAAGTDIPDKEAASFFEAILAAVRADKPPATALRDARVAALQGGLSEWKTSVVVFE